VFLNRALIQSLLLVAFFWGAAGLEGGEPQGQGAEAQGQKGGIADLIDRIPLGQLEDGVLLQSGDLKISLSTLDKVEAAYVAASRRKQPKFTLTPTQETYFRKGMAFQLLRNALIEKYAADNKLEIPNADFDVKFEKFKEGAKQNGVSYEQYLADLGLADEDLRRFWRANWALEKKIGETVSEEEVNKAAGEMTDKAALRRVSHVLFMYKGGERAPADVTRTKEEAKAAAEDIIKKLNKGEDFAKLAKEYSDCPSKNQGGDLNFFPRKGAMVQPFSEAAYSLAKVGDFTQTPVETQFGFHVIKLTDLRSDDQVKEGTRQYLVSQKANKQTQQLLEEAVANAKFNAKVLQK